MSGILQTLIGSLAGAAKDAFFKYVSLLLPGNGTNGAQNNTFLDASTNNFTITRNGNTTQGTFSPYGSNWSNYFDGTGDNLSVPSNAAFHFGSGDLTVEAWVYWAGATPSTPTGNVIIQNGNGANPSGSNWYLGFSYSTGGTQKISFYLYSSSTETEFRSSTNLPLATWTHIAAVRSGNTVTLYQNGIAVNTTAYSSTVNSNTQAVTIGSNATSTVNNWNGYLSNVRVVKGTAVYTAAFTPPSAPLTAITNTSLLTCQSNRFIDNSTNAFAITRNGDVSVQRFSPFSPSAAYAAADIGGSGYFDGAGDYLTAPANAAYDFGTGNFTVEFWFNRIAPVVQSFHDNLVGNRPNSFSSGMWHIYVGPAANDPFTWQARTPAGDFVMSGGTCRNGEWNHVAVVRNGNTITLYINGTSVNSLSTTTSIGNSSSAISIGAFTDGAFPCRGYFSSVRLVKGTAVYTSNFTPPTTPLTAITNTSLLLNFTNAGIIDNAMMNDLETVGNAQISTAQSKFGGSSIAFDGTGDYLVIPNTPNFSFGTGNFTLEFWINFSNISSYQTIYSYGYTTSGDLLIQTGNGNGRMIVYVNGSAVITESGTASTGSWIHYALVRNGATLTLYRDGSSSGSATNSTDINTTEVIGIGANPLNYGGSPPGSAPFYGYIDDFRITKGYARYTTNFTPPTAAFPTS